MANERVSTEMGEKAPFDYKEGWEAETIIKEVK